MKTLIESLLEESLLDDEDVLSKDLDKAVLYYKEAIKFIKSKKHGIHPNTIRSAMMYYDVKDMFNNENLIRQYLGEYGDCTEEEVMFYKVMYEIEILCNQKYGIRYSDWWCMSLMREFWEFGDYKDMYKDIVPLKPYKKMSQNQADQLQTCGMSDDVVKYFKDCKLWQWIPDLNFDNQSWVMSIPKFLPPHLQMVLEELIKHNQKYLKVKL